MQFFLRSKVSDAKAVLLLYLSAHSTNYFIQGLQALPKPSYEEIIQRYTTAFNHLSGVIFSSNRQILKQLFTLQLELTNEVLTKIADFTAFLKKLKTSFTVTQCPVGASLLIIDDPLRSIKKSQKAWWMRNEITTTAWVIIMHAALTNLILILQLASTKMCSLITNRLAYHSTPLKINHIISLARNRTRTCILILWQL